MDLRLDHLNSFMKVAETGSFSAAAINLKKSQGAISQQIAHLEKYFGAVLFNRTIKGVSLTEEGKVLLKRSKEIFELIESTQRDIDEMKDEHRGRITIAASTIPGEHVLPRIVSQFKQEYPQVQIEIEPSASVLSLMKLEENKVDFAAIGSPLGSADKFETIILAEEELVVIVAPNDPLANLKEIEPSVIVKHPFIARSKDSGTRIESEKILQAAGVSPPDLQIHLELATTEAVITAVAEGSGVSIISSIAARKAAAAKRIKILTMVGTNPPSRNIFLYRLRKKTHDPIQALFWNQVMIYVKNN